ncbi:MAG TPA: hypothetical protein VKA63_03860 [Candidatus Krumholzibacteria bacterium]|nr:hypothetical protein [Candidatus Krumholzibacteria bacterium]
MDMRRILPSLLLLLGLTVPLPVHADTVAAPADSGSVHFHFAPKDGEVWVEDLVDTRISDPGGDLAVRTEQTTESDTLLFDRQGEGWRITRVMGPASSVINDHPFDNPILKLSRGARVELSCDARGRATSVKGYRRLVRKLERSLSPDVWAKYQSTFSLEGARDNEIRRWNLRRAGLIGSEVKDGENWNYQSLFPTPMGYLELRGTMHFGGCIDYEGRRAYKIQLNFASGSNVPTSKDATRELDLRPAEYTASNSDISELKGSTARIIDPLTGHVLYETTKVSWKESAIRGSEQMVGKEVTMTYRLHPVSERGQ